MLGTIAGHVGMLVAMWIVLALVGLNMLLSLAKNLSGKADFSDMAAAATKPLLYDIFPLVLLSLLTAIDPTHILILIWYYIAAALIAVRTLVALSRGLRR